MSASVVTQTITRPMSAASQLIPIITSEDDAVRNRSLDAVCEAASAEQLLTECAALEDFWLALRKLSSAMPQLVRI